MPIVCELNADLGVVFTTVTGILTDDVLLAHAVDGIGPRFANNKHLLFE